MQKKNDRRGKRQWKRSAALIGLGIGIIVLIGMCLITSMLVLSDKLSENEIVTFAILAMSISGFAAALISAKLLDAKAGLLTAVMFIAVRFLAGVFSGEQLFGKVTIITIFAMLICGLGGAALGGRRTKRRRG